MRVLLQLPLLLLAVPALLLCAQLLAALPRRHTRLAPPAMWPSRPLLAVLVPAHNEAAGITATMDAVRRQLTDGDQLLVVADNCDDNTAAIAASAAIVIDRKEPHLRGKAYALTFGLQWLAQCPPAIVICIDADCTLSEHALDWLAWRCASTGRPAQARYLMHSPAPATPKHLIAEFAWRLKNCLRALGRERLGMACQLTGSGMAFPWSALQNIVVENHLAEDLAFGLALAAQGHAPVYCHEAIIHSTFAGNAEGGAAQRTRWEHGHLDLLRRHAPRHLFDALRRRNWPHASLALDLCIPPLSLLILLVALASAATLLVQPWLLLPSAMLAATLLATWAIHGRDLLPLRRLGGVAGYILAKIPLYLRRRQRDWIATKRD
jgi:cellulose synthase/poly-beta-1,6-N-acetylglucosamine synthase-like glycosyltransferase